MLTPFESKLEKDLGSFISEDFAYWKYFYEFCMEIHVCQNLSFDKILQNICWRRPFIYHYI